MSNRYRFRYRVDIASTSKLNFPSGRVQVDREELQEVLRVREKDLELLQCKISGLDKMLNSRQARIAVLERDCETRARRIAELEKVRVVCSSAPVFSFALHC